MRRRTELGVGKEKGRKRFREKRKSRRTEK